MNEEQTQSSFPAGNQASDGNDQLREKAKRIEDGASYILLIKVSLNPSMSKENQSDSKRLDRIRTAARKALQDESIAKAREVVNHTTLIDDLVCRTILIKGDQRVETES